MSRSPQSPEGYDDSSIAASKPLTLEEVEGLLLDGGRLFAKNRERVLHLLERFKATIRDNQRKMSDLHDDVDRIRGVRAETEHPMAKAAAALAELDLQQQAMLLDANYIAAMEDLETQRKEVDNIRLLAINDINRTRSLIATLAADGDLDPNTSTKLQELLRQINSMRS